jgi:radical SAM superfamily enzyme YgiQ (UPF0313 family)
VRDAAAVGDLDPFAHRMTDYFGQSAAVTAPPPDFMPGRILLISANRCTVPDPVFPLGLAHISAALRRAGHETRWLDRLSNLDRLVETLQEFQPDLVGISLRNIDDVQIRQQQRFYDELAPFTAIIRQHSQAPVVLGGSGFCIFPEKLLALTGADYGIAGEGEPGIIALLDALNNGRDFSRVPGLVHRRGGKIVINPSAPGPLESPLTAADRPPEITTTYLAASCTLNLQTQRGCHFLCCYCTYPVIEGKNNRRRPPEVVVAELEDLQRQGAKFVFIVDSVFNSTPRHVTEICEAIIRHKVKISWGCFLRPCNLTAELMDLMARAGLTHIEFGTDSFSDVTLKTYAKHFTFADVLESSELARKRNIEYCHFLICGGPGETLETLQEGFENSLRLKNTANMAVVGMRIYPGTPLFEQAVADGIIQRDTDLLTPAYYLAPGLTEEMIFARLREFTQLSPSWIVGDPLPGYQQLIQRLRKRGVVGPLWSYLSTVQRIWRPNPTTE